MDREQYRKWAAVVRDRVTRQIWMGKGMHEKNPEAIIVCGECQYVFTHDDGLVQYTYDGRILWRGIPVVRSGGKNSVTIVWQAEDVEIPPEPKEKIKEEIL